MHGYLPNSRFSSPKHKPTSLRCSGPGGMPQSCMVQAWMHPITAFWWYLSYSTCCTACIASKLEIPTLQTCIYKTQALEQLQTKGKSRNCSQNGPEKRNIQGLDAPIKYWWKLSQKPDQVPGSKLRFHQVPPSCYDAFGRFFAKKVPCKGVF